MHFDERGELSDPRVEDLNKVGWGIESKLGGVRTRYQTSHWTIDFTVCGFQGVGGGVWGGIT